MHRIVFASLVALGLTACTTPQEGVTLTTISPAKCFYDSNLNQQRCRNDVAFKGYAAHEPRAYRHKIDTSTNPLAGVIYGDGSDKPTAYEYGYDARFESGYRTAGRFDTTVYEGSYITAEPPASARRPYR